MSLNKGAKRADLKIEGEWFGVFVHQPHRGIIHVTFQEQDEVIEGTWDFPRVKKGAGATGKFTATRFANWIQVHVKTRPVARAEFRLNIVQAGGQSMIFGVIPLRNFEVPFASVTLFRGVPSEREMDGICPINPRDLPLPL